jgi:group I intron endonuclease
MGCIYLIRNKVNDKVYVGQTKYDSVKKRYRNKRLQYFGGNDRPLVKAIKSHGIDAFEFIDIETNVPDEKLDEREIHNIQLYKATQREYGYNVESGGKRNKTVSEETKKKIAQSRMSSLNHSYKSRSWYHHIHGFFVGGVSDLVRAFPNEKLSAAALSQLALPYGKPKSHKGWISLDTPKEINVVKIERFHWVHQLYPDFYGSPTELKNKYPELNLSTRHLWSIARKKDNRVIHKGWTTEGLECSHTRKIVRVWESPEGEKIKCCATQLTENFPILKRHQLKELVDGKKTELYGWKYLGDFNIEKLKTKDQNETV